MKSLAISLILTVFCIGSIESYQHVDHCYIESQHQLVLQLNCMDAISHPAEFSPKPNQTPLDLIKDVDTIHRFAQHYCPILKRFANCLPLGLNVSEECRTPMHYESEMNRFRVLDLVFNWACDNDAHILVEILRDDGLRTIMFSNEFDHCSRILNVTPAYIGNDPPFVINSDYCVALQSVLDCYSDLVKSHKNRNLVRLAGEIYNRVRDLWGC